MVPLLHAADAATHAPPWLLVMLVLAGAGFGAMLSSGGGWLRRLRGEPTPPFRLLRSGRRDGHWWAEVEVGGTDGVLPVHRWRAVTRGGASLAPTVELLRDGEVRVLGLVVPLDGADAVVELAFEGEGAVAIAE